MSGYTMPTLVILGTIFGIREKVLNIIVRTFEIISCSDVCFRNCFGSPMTIRVVFKDLEVTKYEMVKIPVS